MLYKVIYSSGQMTLFFASVFDGEATAKQLA